MTPKHRRPTRTDRLLLWAKDRLTLRRRTRVRQVEVEINLDTSAVERSLAQIAAMEPRGRWGFTKRPVLVTADFEEALAEQEAVWNRWADESVAIANTEAFARRLLSEDGWAETLADIDELPEVRS